MVLISGEGGKIWKDLKSRRGEAFFISLLLGFGC